VRPSKENYVKIVSTISRFLLALTFTVFGLNGFLNFIPATPIPPIAMQFAGALVQSHYMTVVFVLELACGLLLLANQYVALALAILAPIIVNIVLFHLLMAPAGLPVALFVSLLWMLLAYNVRFAFSGLFRQHPASV
jgi:putative oxidoreductase